MQLCGLFFRERLRKAGVIEELFEDCLRRISALRGPPPFPPPKISGGQIIDATLVQLPNATPNTREENKEIRQKLEGCRKGWE